MYRHLIFFLILPACTLTLQANPGQKDDVDVVNPGNADVEDVEDNPADTGSPQQPEYFDLRITNLETWDSSYSEDVTVSVEIFNDSDQATGSFSVDLYDDERPAWSARVEVVTIGANQTLEITFLDDVTSCLSECQYWASVDSLDEVTEVDEANNSSSHVSFVGKPLPDLHVEDVWLYSYGTAYAEVEVANLSIYDVPGYFYVDVFLDPFGAPAATDYSAHFNSSEAIPAGGSTVVSVYLGEDVCVFGCEAWVVLDNFNQIEEYNELDSVSGPWSL